MTENLELNKKDKKLFNILRILIFVVFILGLAYFSCRILFPSEYFTQSFDNMNSLKNTITDVSKNDESVSFFASTAQDFSEIKVDIELREKSLQFEESSLSLKKSYKAFFYPSSPSINVPDFKGNTLASSAESIFVLSKEEKSPIDNPLTFIGLGYNWNNIESKKIDLSKYEKNKLLNINSAHPNGTILETDTGKYFLIIEGTKGELNTSQQLKAKDLKNNILVKEKSLITQENCQLEKNIIFSNKYSCVIPIEKISEFDGKDYKFELSNISGGANIKEINLEFKKSFNKNNLSIFIADTKNKIRARFSGENL